MNRKLHNTVIALSASFGLLLLTLGTAKVPTTPPGAMSAPELQVAITQAMQDAEQATESASAAASAAKSALESVRRSRRSMAMPYFSFAPRG